MSEQEQTKDLVELARQHGTEHLMCDHGPPAEMSDAEKVAWEEGRRRAQADVRDNDKRIQDAARDVLNWCVGIVGNKATPKQVEELNNLIFGFGFAIARGAWDKGRDDAYAQISQNVVMAALKEAGINVQATDLGPQDAVLVPGKGGVQ